MSWLAELDTYIRVLLGFMVGGSLLFLFWGIYGSLRAAEARAEALAKELGLAIEYLRDYGFEHTAQLLTDRLRRINGSDTDA